MISAKEGKDRLAEARAWFDRAVSHYESSGWANDVDRDSRFYHGDQWTSEDVAYLKKQNRPALTFNVIQSKLMHLIGSHEDNLQEPVVVGVGPEDQAVADVLNRLRERISESIDQAAIDAEVFEDGIVCGMGTACIDAMPDPADPARVKILFRSLSPLEVLWDPASERRDRADARCVFISRWLSRAEFKVEYPEFADRIDEIFTELRGGDVTGARLNPVNQSISDEGLLARTSRYYDRHQDQVRVVRMEYRLAEKVKLAFDPATGSSREVTPEVARAMRAVAPDVEIGDHWREGVYWMEFIRDEVLYDDASPLPIDGFTAASFVCHDDHRGLPYGKVRQLRDPQSEVNKRFSQMLYLLMQQSQPGVFAEAGAFVDRTQAAESLKQAGSVTDLNVGGLSKIQPRPVPEFPSAPAMVHEQALKLISQISGIWQDQMMEPRGVPEAAATAQLHHRQSLLAMRPVMRGFDLYQRAVASKIVQIIVGILPDEQIAEMLGNDERWQVSGRVVTDAQTGAAISLSSIRELKWNIDIRPADENNTQRLLELQLVIQLLGVGMPIDPEVVIELTMLPQDKKERLRAFLASQREAQAKSAAADAQAASEQIDRMAQLEAADRQIAAAGLAEKSRHNKALEMVAGMKFGESTRAARAGETVAGGRLAVEVHGAALERERMVMDVVQEVLAQIGQRNAPQSESTPQREPAQDAGSQG